MDLAFVRATAHRAIRRAGSPFPRVVAWALLLAATSYLVRGEIRRPEVPAGIDVYPDLAYRNIDRKSLRLDVYVPSEPPPPGGRPALVAVHGGGWRGGSKADYGRSLVDLARRGGFVVVSIDYRLSAPSTPSWPENREDVREGLGWVSRHAREFSIDRSRVGLIGSSAGAQLALALAFDPDLREPVSAVIDFYGPTDLRALAANPTASQPVFQMLGGSPRDRPERYEAASPVLHVTKNAPPVLILHGGEDVRVPPEQSHALDRALTAAGVDHRLIILPKARHGFGLQAGERDLVPEIIGFLRGVWGHRERDRAVSAR